jgi:hypothetical protein
VSIEKPAVLPIGSAPKTYRRDPWVHSAVASPVLAEPDPVRLGFVDGACAFVASRPVTALWLSCGLGLSWVLHLLSPISTCR